MLRSAKLPLLPGYSFEREVGQTRFHKSTQFEYLRGSMPYLTEADRPGVGGCPVSWATPDTTPSIYPRRDSNELPGWLAYDKQILAFEAYFQEAMWEVDKSPFQIRKVKILYFPEDGTIQVNEPKEDNSGMAQGVLIARQRIRFPKPMDHAFYDMIDFNIGKNVELYGRVFRIVNCDQFTRNFLNRMGIFVGDPLNYPTDPHRVREEQKKYINMGKKPRKSGPILGRYLEFDKKVLRFYGYWDDRSTQYGRVHRLEIHFFLADDTVEVLEASPAGGGVDSGVMFLKRMKLPKSYTGLPGPGEDETTSILNVLPTGFLKGRVTVDSISRSLPKTSYYRENDLAIGAIVNVFGRKVVLVDCDEYTKEFYRTKYGVETFDKLAIPDDGDVVASNKSELPPWNGIGSYEDSEGNCRNVIPRPPKKDIIKFLTKDRVGADSHILRFKAKMISTDSVNDDRNFIVSYYLTDDQISVYERASKNSGFASQCFVRKREIFKPDQERFVPIKPETFQKDDLWVGNVLKLEGFRFKLVSADEYCFRYMELNCQEFPKSNAKLVLDKIREKLRPVYKDFVKCYLRPCLETQNGCGGVLSYCDLRRGLMDLFGDDISEHEIITIARQFRLSPPRLRQTKNDVVDICRTDCRRYIWLGFDRLREYLCYRDWNRTGFVSEHDALCLCKGAKIPIETDLLNTIIKLADRNECGEISVEDLLNFFDTQKKLSKPCVPVNQKREFSEFVKVEESTDYSWIDCDCFIKGLGLEEDLAKEGHADEEATTEITPAQASTLPH